MQIHAARDRQVRAKERPVPGADADAPADAVEDAPADNVAPRLGKWRVCFGHWIFGLELCFGLDHRGK